MDNIDIFAEFLKLFPKLHGYILSWASVRPGTILLTFTGNQEYVFSYKNKTDWSLLANG